MALRNKSLFFLENACYNGTGDSMGKYRLIAIDSQNNSEHIIHVYNQETGKYEESVHIKDIDNLTSQYLDDSNFIADLNAQGITNFTKGTTKIVSKFKEKDLCFKTIYHSKLIESCAKEVKHGFIQVGDNDAYDLFYAEFMEKLKTNSNFRKAIETTKYINPTVKMLFLNYYLTLSQDINEEELQEQQKLKIAIANEFKRYKTFRGLYIFMDECKQNKKLSVAHKNVNKLIEKPVERMKSYEEVHPINEGLSAVDRYNQMHEEYLSEEEYDVAYGDNGEYEGNSAKPYMKKKGVHNDKYTK